MCRPWSLVTWSPCRLVEVWVECKTALNASRALLVLEHNVKKAGPPYNLVLRFPYADSSVECKNGVNVALHNYLLSIIIILKKRSAADVPRGPKGVSVASFLSIIIILKRIGRLNIY